VIEKDKMTISNANRAERSGLITPDDFEPNPKNPIIAAFFRNIGMADELGSGVRNLFKFGKRYSGQDPQLIDGDIFKIIVPLDDDYSFDAETNKAQLNHDNFGKDFGINETQQRMVALIVEDVYITTERLAKTIGITQRQIESNIRKLKSLEIIEREGGRRYGRWIVKQ